MVWYRYAYIAALALSVALPPACRSNTSQQPAAAAVTADTWAVVDGRQIKREDVDKAFRRARDASQPISDEEALAAKLTLLDELILQDILLAKARELKIEVPDSELDTAYAEARKNMADQQFNQELAKRGLTAGDMREGLRREMLARKVIEKEVTSKIAVSDQDVSDFFHANRAQFNVPEEAYRVAQIVVTPVRDPQLANRTGDDAVTALAAQAKVRTLMEKLKSGASFRDLAADYSEDPESAPRGGDLGFISVSQLKQAPPQLRNAVLNKSPGSVNVVTEGGAYSLVLVVAHEQPGQRDLSMPVVKDNITQTLKSRKEQLLRSAYLTAARTDAKIENYLARRVVEAQGKAAPGLLAPPGAK